MKLPSDKTIPSDFQRLDTRTHLDNSFANVRDQQRLRQNHNWLVAEWSRRTLFTTSLYDSAANTGIDFRMRTPDGSRSNRPIVWSGFVHTTPYAMEVMLDVFGGRTAQALGSTFNPPGVGDHPSVGVRLSHPEDVSGSDESTIQWVDVTAASGPGLDASYTVTVGIPSTLRSSNLAFGYYQWLCEVFLRCQVDHTQTRDSGLTIVGAGTRWVDVSGLSNTAKYHIVYFSNTAIEARQVVAVHPVGANHRLHLDESFGELPVPGTDTLSSREMVGVAIRGLSLIELPTTDFSSVVGTI